MQGHKRVLILWPIKNNNALLLRSAWVQLKSESLQGSGQAFWLSGSRVLAGRAVPCHSHAVFVLQDTFLYACNVRKCSAGINSAESCLFRGEQRKVIFFMKNVPFEPSWRVVQPPPRSSSAEESAGTMPCPQDSRKGLSFASRMNTNRIPKKGGEKGLH